MKVLTLKDQGELCYTISPNNRPRLRVDPGETIVVDTEDAFSGQVRKEGDKRDQKSIPYPNPQSGPIYVEGAKKGDTLVVKVDDIQPLIGQGATRISSFWYTSKYDSDVFDRFRSDSPVPHGTRICPIKDGNVYFDKYVLPYRPMIGTIGTADSMETYTTWFPGPHGGNMDISEITTGATLYMPVRVDGALLHLGDAHAIQGDGELSGTAVEMPAKVQLTVDLVRDKPISWPRLENKDMLFAIASMQTGRALQDAIRLAFMELLFWIEEDYGLEKWLMFELLTFESVIKVGNFWTVAVGIPKKYLR